MTNVSVVIPCRNEAPFIEECIQAIYASELNVGIQLTVFVVDGMSDDGTREKIANLQNQFPSLNLVDNSQQLTPFAFNLGIRADENADYIQIVGARHILSSNYIQQCLNHLIQNETIWCVGGKIINEYVNETGEFIAKAMGTSFGMGLGNFRTLNKSGFTDTVTSPMYPKWVFEKIGYFDEELTRNQDDDFNFRVAKAGGKIYYENEMSLKYYVRGSYKNLWKQFLQYGYWKVYVNKKHKTVTTIRQLVPFLFVCFLLFSPSLFLINTILGFGGLGVIGFYMLLTIFVSIQISSSLSDFFRTVIIFPILHVSYGWGYLRGIESFLILNKKPKDKHKKMSR